MITLPLHPDDINPVYINSYNKTCRAQPPNLERGDFPLDDVQPGDVTCSTRISSFAMFIHSQVEYLNASSNSTLKH